LAAEVGEAAEELMVRLGDGILVGHRRVMGIELSWTKETSIHGDRSSMIQNRDSIYTHIPVAKPVLIPFSFLGLELRDQISASLAAHLPLALHCVSTHAPDLHQNHTPSNRNLHQ
jgi:hypothetical protein